MTKLKIPFLYRFKESMLRGVKRQTARTRRFGNPGDTFLAWNETFQINAVYQTVLAVIRLQWKAEGVSSPEEFDQVWSQIHPRKQWNGGELLYVHTFSKVDPEHLYPYRPCWECARPFIPTFNDTQVDCPECLDKKTPHDEDDSYL